MGLAQGGIPGAAFGAMMSADPTLSNRRQANVNAEDTLRDTKVRQAQANLAATQSDIRFRDLMSAGQAKDNLIKSKQVDNYSDEFNIDYEKKAADVVSERSKLWGPPTQVVPNTDKAAIAHLEDLTKQDGAVGMWSELHTKDVTYAWDMRNMISNVGASVQTINDAAAARGGLQAPQINSQRFLAMKPEQQIEEVRKAQEFLDGMQNDPNKAEGQASIYATLLASRKAEPGFEMAHPGLLKKLETASALQQTMGQEHRRNANQDKIDVANAQGINRQNLANANPTTYFVGRTKDGTMVAGSPEELQASGVQGGYQKMPTEEVNKMNTARSLISGPDSLFNQLASDFRGVEAAGGLNALTSRWDEFMAGKGGFAGGPYTKLRTDLGLSNTALMQVHVGARGSSALMEHFEDLANAKRMDSHTLRAALQSEYTYLTTKAMLPKQPKGQ